MKLNRILFTVIIGLITINTQLFSAHAGKLKGENLLANFRNFANGLEQNRTTYLRQMNTCLNNSLLLGGVFIRTTKKTRAAAARTRERYSGMQ